MPVPRTAEPDIENARSIARELARAGQRISRRALRSRGVTGSNETLNVLALALSAELANGPESHPLKQQGHPSHMPNSATWVTAATKAPGLMTNMIEIVALDR